MRVGSLKLLRRIWETHYVLAENQDLSHSGPSVCSGSNITFNHVWIKKCTLDAHVYVFLNYTKRTLHALRSLRIEFWSVLSIKPKIRMMCCQSGGGLFQTSCSPTHDVEMGTCLSSKKIFKKISLQGARMKPRMECSCSSLFLTKIQEVTCQIVPCYIYGHPLNCLGLISRPFIPSQIPIKED